MSDMKRQRAARKIQRAVITREVPVHYVDADFAHWLLDGNDFPDVTNSTVTVTSEPVEREVTITLPEREALYWRAGDERVEGHEGVLRAACRAALGEER